MFTIKAQDELRQLDNVDSFLVETGSMQNLHHMKGVLLICKCLMQNFIFVAMIVNNNFGNCNY